MSRRGVTLALSVALVAACGDRDAGEKQTATGSAAPTGTCALPEDGEVKTSVTLSKGCKLSVTRVAVSAGATLTLEPGVVLTFANDGALDVRDGQLVSKGTSREPVLLTGAGKSPGAWTGVIISGDAKDGNLIEQTTIEFAGKKTPVTNAALTAYELDARRITITNATFRDNVGAGLHGRDAWKSVTGSTFTSNGGVAIRTSAAGLTAIGKNKIAEPIVVEGARMEVSGTWPATGAPVVVSEALRVGKAGAPATLTIETGAVIRVQDAIYFENGSLQAKGVQFTSVNTPPGEGDWRGLVFEGGSAGSSLDGCTIEFAGKENAIGPGAGVILYETPELGKDVKVTSSTFKRNKFGGIRGKGCATAEASGNKAEGTPLCAPD